MIPGLANSQLFLPESASDIAVEHDSLFMFISFVCLFFMTLILFLMVFFAFKYRRTSTAPPPKTRSHNLLLEIIWTIPPIVIVIIIFFLSLKTFLLAYSPKSNALDIQLRAFKWNWEFTYPDSKGFTSPELHIPKDIPVKLTLRSDDVIHSFFVPAFRIKRDVVPGRYNKMWFTATKQGTYPAFCAEYCGTGHSTMLTTVTVHETYDHYKAWLTQASRKVFEELDDNLYKQWLAVRNEQQFESFTNKLKDINPEWAEKAEQLKPPLIVGQSLHKTKGCFQCHSSDGSPLQGPTLKGLYNRLRVFTDRSSLVADENYIRQSILNPQAKIVENYPNIMPTYLGKITDRQIDALIAFIQSLNSNTTTTEPRQ